LEHLPSKCTVTPITTAVAMVGMDDLEQLYKALVRRIRCNPMPGAVRAGILAQIEAAYRRERAGLERQATDSPPAG